jgi:hypothetical protein
MAYVFPVYAPDPWRLYLSQFKKAAVPMWSVSL